MPYISYTDEQKYLANHTDLAEFLRRRGETLKRDGHEFRWSSGHASVTIRGNEWYQHSAERGGYPVSFCMKFFGLDYQESMNLLLGGNMPIISSDSKPPPEPKEFILPEANHTMRRVYAYLTKNRGIDASVITEFVHQRKIYEDIRHNIVFVGKDENGKAKFAAKKGTNSFGQSYRGNVSGSDKRYGFNHVGKSRRLFVFESPIDMMSYITMYKIDWQNENYISLDGVTDKSILHFLHQNPHITDVYLCLDNDPAGIEANGRLKKVLQGQGKNAEILAPELKDWNEDLISRTNQGMELMN